MSAFVCTCVCAGTATLATILAWSTPVFSASTLTVMTSCLPLFLFDAPPPPLGRAELEKQGLLDNTYIIYTGDNGYHIGAYRQGAGKETAYESDIR